MRGRREPASTRLRTTEYVIPRNPSAQARVGGSGKGRTDKNKILVESGRARVKDHLKSS